ncbi:hypothetical protein FHG87_007689 [Trinorchestia longiramus]|nr:hypothetical protein FHG87_007689 [Trinorchestia longiramus]
MTSQIVSQENIMTPQIVSQDNIMTPQIVSQDNIMTPQIVKVSVSQSGPYHPSEGVEKMQGSVRRVRFEWGVYITV